jgi:hypothetical protein
MIGMLLHPSSPLATLCGRQPQAAACPFSDLNITRTAHRWIQRHGDAATARAREMVEEMRRRGDGEGADTWLRIIVAVCTLAARRRAKTDQAIWTVGWPSPRWVSHPSK